MNDICIFTSIIINWHQTNQNGLFYVPTENLALLKKHYIQNLQIETFLVQLKQAQIEALGCPI